LSCDRSLPTIIGCSAVSFHVQVAATIIAKLQFKSRATCEYPTVCAFCIIFSRFLALTQGFMILALGRELKSPI
jgi:hypothetical protein